VLNVIGILFARVQEALLMALYERGTDGVEAINNRAADRLAAKRIRKVMAILDAVEFYDL
jgi:hypothetical protein